MKPITIRQRLEKFGEVTRVYILPEGMSPSPCRSDDPSQSFFTITADPAIRMARIRRGGSKRENWLEGWVEFGRKKEAREIAEHLNTTAVGMSECTPASASASASLLHAQTPREKECTEANYGP